MLKIGFSMEIIVKAILTIWQYACLIMIFRVAAENKQKIKDTCWI